MRVKWIVVFPIILFFFKIIYLFTFGCARAFSTCGAQASPCGGLSCCGAWALGAWASVVVARGLSSCLSRAREHRLSSCGARA